MENFNIIEYFKKKAIDNNKIFSVEVDVTSVCNADCVFCFQGSHCKNKDKLNLNDYIKLFDELKRLGCYSIGFSGGEPFCRKDFIDILREAKKRGFRVSFITNGQLITKEDVEQLEDIFIDRITVSVHSLDIENYNYHFGINDNDRFKRAMYAIKLMLSKGLSVGIAVTVTNKNIGELNDIKNYFMKLGLKSTDINYNSLLTGAKNIEELRPKEEQLKNTKYRKINNQGFLCSAGIISCSISWDGSVYPCTFFNTSVGNILEDSLENIWNNSHFLKILRSINNKQFTKCSKCKIKEKCNVCLVTNINETGNIFIPSEGYCNNKKGLINEC